LRARFAKLESRRSPEATVRSNARAAIAYELGSAYWGRGLASQAVQAMIGELVEHYGVRKLSAVFKSENHRSVRLLERLGFSPASSEEHGDPLQVTLQC
jgi:RimJ/RimL family protein N-acetyltransferase